MGLVILQALCYLRCFLKEWFGLYGFVLCDLWDGRHVTFICGRAGVCALGAVVAKYNSNGRLCDQYINKFKEVIDSALTFA